MLFFKGFATQITRFVLGFDNCVASRKLRSKVAISFCSSIASILHPPLVPLSHMGRCGQYGTNGTATFRLSDAASATCSIAAQAQPERCAMCFCQPGDPCSIRQVQNRGGCVARIASSVTFHKLQTTTSPLMTSSCVPDVPGIAATRGPRSRRGRRKFLRRPRNEGEAGRSIGRIGLCRFGRRYGRAE